MLTLCLPVAGIQEEAVAIGGGGRMVGRREEDNKPTLHHRSLLFGPLHILFHCNFPINRDTRKCYMLLCSPIYVVGHRGRHRGEDSIVK